MKKRHLSVLAVFLLCGCTIQGNGSSQESASSQISAGNSSFSSEEGSSSGEAVSSSSTSGSDEEILYAFDAPDFSCARRNAKEEFEFADLFNLQNHVSIQVEISDEELNELQKNYLTGYKCETYRLADKVTIQLTNYGNTFTWEFDNVGIRQKGNTSRQNILIDDSINPENHFKLSFDETFDDPELYTPEFIAATKAKMNGADYADREFLGTSGLDIKWNKNEDATHIREVYSSYLYQAGGILSQHIGLTEFSMIRKDRDDSVTSFGLCTLYEPTSKSIVKRTLQNGKTYLNMTSWKKEKAGCYGVPDVNYGDLYKCTYGVGEGNYGEGADLSAESIREKRIGIGNNAGSYLPVYERKTNPDAAYDDGLLKDLVQKIDSGTYEDIAERIDLDYFAKEEAITYLIGNPDALRYNNNNYLLYFRRTDGKAIVIPYDNDRCFGITKDFDVMNGMTDAGVLSMRIAQNKQANSLFRKTLLSEEDNEAKTVYLKVLDVLKNSDWAKCETFDRYYDIASATYASESFDKGGVNLPFETYLNAKLKQIGATSGDDTVYDNLYVVGNFNSWGDYPADDLEKYRMERVGDHLYRAEIRIDEPLPEDTLQFKFNNGQQNYDLIDWTLDASLTKLIKEVGGNARLENVYAGDTIQIEIDTANLSASVEKTASGGAWVVENAISGRTRV